MIDPSGMWGEESDPFGSGFGKSPFQQSIEDAWKRKDDPGYAPERSPWDKPNYIAGKAGESGTPPDGGDEVPATTTTGENMIGEVTITPDTQALMYGSNFAPSESNNAFVGPNNSEPDFWESWAQSKSLLGKILI